jgi:sugar/nucleoside kinase (ribokinase family)
MSRIPEVVVVGAASRDLDPADARGWRLGGGVSYVGLALSRLGFRVGVLIGLDGPALAAIELDLLRDAGAEVVAVPLAHGPVFVNQERPGGRVQLCVDASDRVPVPALPAEWRDVAAWVLAPVAAELPDDWAAVPPEGALVALGWQGLLRALRPGAVVRRVAPGPSPLVARADLLGVGRDDIDTDVTASNLARLAHPGATLLLTNGARGGVALAAGEGGAITGIRTWRSIAPARLVDPVGAGDTFLAGVFAARLDPSILAGIGGSDRDLRLGAAIASLVVEAPGMFGVPDRAAVLDRLRSAGEGPLRSSADRG